MKKLSKSEMLNRLGIMIIFFLTVGMVQLPLMSTANQTASMQLWGVVGYYLAYVVMIIFAFYCYQRDGHFHPRPFKPINLLWIIGSYVFFYLIQVILMIMSEKFTHVATSKNQEVIQNTMSSNHITVVAMAIGLVFFTPILEETIFRGYLMNAFFRPDQWFLPIVISGIVFSLSHLQSNIFTFAVYMLMGMTLAFVYRKTGNLKSSILLHALNNLVAVIQMIYLMR